jgi:hypothetical protein
MASEVGEGGLTVGSGGNALLSPVNGALAGVRSYLLFDTVGEGFTEAVGHCCWVKMD